VGAAATQTFLLTVTQPPAVTSGKGAAFFVGHASRFTITTTGFPLATLSKSGTLPAGVTFTDNGDGTATLTGTPLLGSDSRTPYSFTVQASNGVGAVAGQIFTLTIALAAPMGLTPSGSVVAVNGYDKPTFSWTASAGADHYSLIVHDDNTGASPIIVPNVNGTSYVATAAQALTPGHRFTMSVYAISANSRTNSLATQTFSLAALPMPTLTSPIAGTKASPLRFTWSAVAGAARYYLYVVDDTTGTVAISNPNIMVNSFSLASPLTRGHKYTWRVAVVSTNNLFGIWSAAQDFKIA
jgi:hypothetical protein